MRPPASPHRRTGGRATVPQGPRCGDARVATGPCIGITVGEEVGPRNPQWHGDRPLHVAGVRSQAPHPVRGVRCRSVSAGGYDGPPATASRGAPWRTRASPATSSSPGPGGSPSSPTSPSSARRGHLARDRGRGKERRGRRHDRDPRCHPGHRGRRARHPDRDAVRTAALRLPRRPGAGARRVRPEQRRRGHRPRARVDRRRDRRLAAGRCHQPRWARVPGRRPSGPETAARTAAVAAARAKADVLAAAAGSTSPGSPTSSKAVPRHPSRSRRPPGCRSLPTAARPSRPGPRTSW